MRLKITAMMVDLLNSVQKIVYGVARPGRLCRDGRVLWPVVGHSEFIAVIDYNKLK